MSLATFDNVRINENLLMALGQTAFIPELRIYGAIYFNNNPGPLGSVIVSTGPTSVASWQYPQYYVQYYDNTIVDMNSGGLGGTILLTNAIPNMTNANITYNAGVFTLLEAGQYQILMQTNATTVTTNAQTLVNIRINGAYAGSFTTTQMASGAVQAVVLQKTFNLLANTTVEIVSVELVAGTINTSPADLAGIATTTIFITRIGAYL
jgi:hypothetical protein